jgi:hypothetical protein
MTAGFHYLALHIYPRIYRIDTLLEQTAAGVLEESTGLVARPDTCPGNGVLLAKTGIYLFDDGDYLHLYVSSCSNPETLDLIFNCMEHDKLPAGEW